MPRDVPALSCAVVDTALAKRIGDRFPDATAFADEARRVAVALGATGPMRAG